MFLLFSSWSNQKVWRSCFTDRIADLRQWAREYADKNSF